MACRVTCHVACHVACHVFAFFYCIILPNETRVDFLSPRCNIGWQDSWPGQVPTANLDRVTPSSDQFVVSRCFKYSIQYVLLMVFSIVLFRFFQFSQSKVTTRKVTPLGWSPPRLRTVPARHTRPGVQHSAVNFTPQGNCRRPRSAEKGMMGLICLIC